MPGRRAPPLLGLAVTPAHSVLLLALGAVAIPAAYSRRAAVTVTSLSAVAYTLLLFFSAVATARAKPTPLGFHAADIVLHGVLAVVNLALLMWLIPDELGDEVWAPRRGRRSGQRHDSGSAAASAPAAAVPAGPTPVAESEAAATSGSRARRDPPTSEVRSQPGPPGSTEQDPPRTLRAAPPASVLSRWPVPWTAAILLVAIGIVAWVRRRHRSGNSGD